MYTLVKICAACEYPANFHTPSHRNQYEFICNRDFENIGMSRWTTEEVTGYTKVTTFADDAFYDEDAHQFNLGTPTEKYYPNGFKDVEDSDYWVIDDQIVLPFDYSGPEALSGGSLMKDRLGSYIKDEYVDEIDYKSADLELRKLDAWHDVAYRATFHGEQLTAQSYVCTSILGDDTPEVSITFQKNRVGNKALAIKEPYNLPIAEPKVKNIFFHNQDGFTSVKLLDELITRKYHATILNVYRDNNPRSSYRGMTRIGGVALKDNVDGTKTAQCVQRKCGQSITTPSFLNLTEEEVREQMERFTWAVVAHGNNHSARWFTERPSFYKVHMLGCEGSPMGNDHSHCSEKSPYCLHVSPPLESADALVEHYRNCTSPGCSCTELLGITDTKTKVSA